MKEQAEQWLAFSRIDLASIEKLMEDELLNQSSAFHAHQSIEKTLKAILELKDKKIPKIHDLESLLGNVKNAGILLNINEDTLDEINQAYIDSRYPC